MNRLSLSILLFILFSGHAFAQACPTSSNSNPQFTDPGTIFGRLATQWNQYFTAKVDANNGTMCNTTFNNSTFNGAVVTNGLTIKSGTVTGVPAPVNSSDAVPKSYVDGKQTGLIPQQNVKWDTGGSILPNSPAYNNGSAGVNATLSATTSNSLILPAGTPALNDRILVRNEVNQINNGVYFLSQLLPWVLTRVNDWNQSAEMVVNSSFFVQVTASTWALSSASLPYPIIVGTSLIIFQQVAGSNVYAADETSLHLNGNVFGALAGGTLFQRNTVSKTINYSIQPVDTGNWFDNGGSTSEVDFTLPSSPADGLYYCFTVITGQTLKVIGAANQQIAVGTINSSFGGNIFSNNPFSSICIHSNITVPNQWITETTVGTWQVN